MAIRLAISGAAGRMGRRLVALAQQDAALRVTAALESADSPHLGDDVGELAGIGRIGVVVNHRPTADFDVLIDFSLPAGTVHRLELCRERQCPVVIGTTGHDDAQRTAIRRAAEVVPVLHAANMSVGVNLILRLVEDLARRLNAEYDVEITEAHHRFKVDAPSGTALALRDAVTRGRIAAGAATPTVVHGREGKTGARPPGEIGIHSLRIGDTVGTHSVSFGTLGETLTIRHTAHSRDTFAAGALRAAKWIVGTNPGLYDMSDVLFPADPAPA